MLPAYTSDQIRAAEAGPLAAGEPLMMTAAYALATAVARELTSRGYRVSGSEVTVFAGGGNNGGDGLYAAAYLARRGASVVVFPVSENVHAGGLAAAIHAGARVLPASATVPEVALRSGVWVDAILGIGYRGPLRVRECRVLNQLVGAQDAAPDEPIVVAADIPSGVGADDASVAGPVLRATRTVTFGGATPGLLVPPGAEYVGVLEVIDLGLELTGADLGLVGDSDAADMIIVPGPTDHKYSRGVVQVHAGSVTYPGAAYLTVAGAQRAGAGMVRLESEVADRVIEAHPEVVPGTGRADAYVFGPGIDDASSIRGDVAAAIDTGSPVVLDAGALALVEGRLGRHVVLTPHAGELSALLGRLGRAVSAAEIADAPLAHARLAAELTGATIVLKGGTTIVIGDRSYAVRAPSSWMATAGAGDVLAGVTGTLLAAHQAAGTGADTALLAACAAWIHARAGAGSGPVLASDIAARIPATLGAILD